MRRYMDEVEAEGRAYLKRLGPKDLDKLFPVPWHKTAFRVEDVLVSVVGECMLHSGEIMSLMWQIDAEPPYEDYPGYLLKVGKHAPKVMKKKPKVMKKKPKKSRK
jgi:hypothetical protein